MNVQGEKRAKGTLHEGSPFFGLLRKSLLNADVPKRMKRLAETVAEFLEGATRKARGGHPPGSRFCLTSELGLIVDSEEEQEGVSVGTARGADYPAHGKGRLLQIKMFFRQQC
jgi:hypothetical protein